MLKRFLQRCGSAEEGAAGHLCGVEGGVALAGDAEEALVEGGLEDVLGEGALVVARRRAGQRVVLEGHVHLRLLGLLVREHAVAGRAVRHQAVPACRLLLHPALREEGTHRGHAARDGLHRGCQQ